MKIRILAFLVLIFSAGSLYAQPIQQGVRYVTSLPATCIATGSASSSAPVRYQGKVYHCTATNTWTAVVTSAGVTIGTTAVTSGTGGRLLYETTGNVVGEISTLTSDGAILTFTPTTTTGTGTTAGLNANADSLTTGDAFNFGSSSVTSGNVFKIAATGTAAAANKTALNVSTSGANATGGLTTYGAQIANTSTGTSVNVALNLSASGGSTNTALNIAAGVYKDFQAGTKALPNIQIGSVNTGVFAQGAAILGFSASGLHVFGISSSYLELGAGKPIVWTASGNPFEVAEDSGIERKGVGTVGPNLGSFGTAGWIQNTGGEGALTAAYTDADATLGATNLSFTLIAGRAYRIKGLLQVSNTTAAEGVQFAFDGGAATATTFFVAATAISGTVVAGTTSATALATPLTFTTTTGTCYIAIDGFIKANAGGTFILRAAEATTATGTVTIGVGSWIALSDTVLK